MRKIVIGLGNPGPSYRETRHNVGFAVVERLATRLKAPRPQQRHASLVSEVDGMQPPLVLAQPLTFMNRSGQAVGLLARTYDVPLTDLLVVYDDVSLPVGSLRIRPRGSAGGHNGMKSIIAVLGSQEFPRMRVGVGPEPPPGMDLADFVLSRFPREDQDAAEAAVDAAADAVELWSAQGIEEAMNRYNGWGWSPPA